MKKGLILMAAILFVSFVPSFAQAQEPKIEDAIAIANGLEQSKQKYCTDDTECEVAFNGVIEFVRKGIGLQKALAAAKASGDVDEQIRIAKEMQQVATDSDLSRTRLRQLLQDRAVAFRKADKN
ncbi:MAG TPA: hypothetical protein VHD38_03395 [Candidatus Paceibacterota bacterium]|nr:hypothetical protein [Candidatus Paceibacterota bacterium]